MKDGYFKRENAKIGFGVLSDYTELPNGTTFYDNDRSTKLERPSILVKNGRPEYLYGCTRADVLGSGKSQCYVFKIKNTNAFQKEISPKGFRLWDFVLSFRFRCHLVF